MLVPCILVLFLVALYLLFVRNDNWWMIPMLGGISLLGYSIYNKTQGSFEPCSDNYFKEVHNSAPAGFRMESKVREMFNCFSSLVGGFEEVKSSTSPEHCPWLFREEEKIVRGGGDSTLKKVKIFLELDGFNNSGYKLVPDLSQAPTPGNLAPMKQVAVAPVAFEFQGQLHYLPKGVNSPQDTKTYVSNGDLGHFLNTARNDDLKKELAKANGVDLIIIHYNIPPTRMGEYIMSRLLDRGLLKPQYFRQRALVPYQEPGTGRTVRPRYMPVIPEPPRMNTQTVAEELKLRNLELATKAERIKLNKEFRYGADVGEKLDALDRKLRELSRGGRFRGGRR